MESEWERDQKLDACIKCSACTAQCPVAAVYPLFPGPKNLGPDLERLRLEGVWLDTSILDYCSNCKTCEVTCPSGVKITEMILGARRAAISHSFSRHTLRNSLLGRADYLGRMGTLWPSLTQRVLRRAPVRWLMEKSLGLSQFAPLPEYQIGFQKTLRMRQKNNINSASSDREKRVVYFPGCFVNYNEPQTGEAVVNVLEHNGFEVIVPDFHCCGVPLQANGNFGAAEENAQQNLALMAPYLKAGLPVITSCTSCGLALKEEYPRVNAAGAERIGLQTYDLFEFLWELHEQGKLRENFQEVPISLGYHAPCHLKAQGIGNPALRLSRLIPGVEVEDLDAGCCGLSGSFGFKEEKYLLAQKIGSPLFQAAKRGVAEGNFQKIITECGGCKVQIKQGTGIETEHPVWTLVKAYRLSSRFFAGIFC